MLSEGWVREWGASLEIQGVSGGMLASSSKCTHGNGSGDGLVSRDIIHRCRSLKRTRRSQQSSVAKSVCLVH